MKALALADFDSQPALFDLPLPEPNVGQVRVRIRAAALNGMDRAIAGGMVKRMADYLFPVVIGREGAGAVDAVAEGVDYASVGDEVIGPSSSVRSFRRPPAERSTRCWTSSASTRQLRQACQGSASRRQGHEHCGRRHRGSTRSRRPPRFR
jgi:NADPH:quinone reductase-like Zn-dependent oxidoreductase